MNLRRHAWLGLCLAMVLGLSGCSAVPVVTPAPQVQPTAAMVVLDVTAHDGLSLAQIRHHDFEQQVNAQLSDYLQPLIDALQPALQDGSVELNYDLQAASGGHVLSIIVAAQGHTAAQWTVRITATGTVEPPATDWIALFQDASFTRHGLSLIRQGIPVDLQRYGTPATGQDGLTLLVGAYEAVTGAVVNAEAVVPDIQDDAARKAAEVGLFTYQTGMDMQELVNAPLYLDSVLGASYYGNPTARMLTNWLERIRKDAMLQASQPVTLVDTTDLMQLFIDLYTVGGDWKPSTQERLAGLGTVQAGVQTELAAEKVLTRRDLAGVFVCLYRHWADGNTVQYYGDWAGELQDVSADEEDIITAVDQSLMQPYPWLNTFSPELTITHAQLPQLVATFTQRLYNQAFPTDGTPTASAIAYEDWVSMVDVALTHYAGQTPTPQPVAEVLNDRSYDWYQSQQDTGPYSQVNCMPTMAAMAIRWYKEDAAVTPQELRDRHPDVTNGWSIDLVGEALQTYGVPYRQMEYDRQSIVQQLDRGGIVLVQINEGSLQESGHCYVIYGYRRQGPNLWFVVMDPGDRDPPADCFGRSSGEAYEIESQYALWTIARYTPFALGIDDIR
jgi:hypothetical protein